MDSIRQEAEVEQFRLAAAQKETAGYVAKVKGPSTPRTQAYLDQLDQLVPAAPDQQEEKMEEAVSDIDDSVQRLVAQAMAEAAAENEKVRQAGESQPAEDLSDTAEFPAQKVQPEENGTWKRPPGSTLESFSSVGTMRSSRSISVLPSEIARPRLSCVSAASACAFFLKCVILRALRGAEYGIQPEGGA